MGSEVRYLVRGLYRQGIVIGSPSPGMADVHEHITELVRTIPSSRLEVVKSAAAVVERTFKAGKRNTDLTDNPALVDLVERAQQSNISLDDWGEWLIPDEFKSLRDQVVAALPNVYTLYQMADRYIMPIELSEKTAAVVWDWIREPATSLGFNEDTGPLFARGIVIRVMQRMERERLWNDALIKRESVTRALAPAVNNVRNTGQVAVAAHSLDAENILVDGRFMTQFEVSNSGGYYNPEYRAATETSMFGIHPEVDPEKRTIYGYVFTPGREDAPGVEQYGEVRFILKPEVRDRTTMSVGDTLGTGAVPIPMTGPDVNAKDAYMATSGVGGGSPAQSLIDEGEDYIQDYDYFEAQIHDGVTTDDIAEIVVTDWMRKSDYDDLVELADGLGIKVRFA
jgi:hypothetical protein